MPSGPWTPHAPVVHAPVKAAELGVDLVLLAAEQDTVPRRPRLLTLPAHTNQFTGNIPDIKFYGYSAIVLGRIPIIRSADSVRPDTDCYILPDTG